MARTQTFLDGEVGLSIRNKLNSIADWTIGYSYNINDITHYGGYVYSSNIDGNIGNHPSSSTSWKSLMLSASYATTASYALNGGGSGGTSLTTGSTYPITASVALNAVSSSYLSSSTNTAYAKVFKAVDTDNNNYINVDGGGLAIRFFENNTSSLSIYDDGVINIQALGKNLNLISPTELVIQSPYTRFTGNISCSVITASLLGTASYANRALSASYSPVQPSYSSSVSSQFGTKQDTLTNTTYTITASYAITTSYANYITYNVTESIVSSSFASSSISSSYALTASYALNGGGSSVSASWVSASVFITTAQTASYVSGSNVKGIVDSASFATTASAATSLTFIPLSASYAPVEPAYSSSVSNQFGTKQDSLVTGNTYSITASVALNAASASYLSGSTALISDKIGIGTSNPTSVLHLSASSDSIYGIKIDNKSGGFSARSDIELTNDSFGKTNVGLIGSVGSSTGDIIQNESYIVGASNLNVGAEFGAIKFVVGAVPSEKMRMTNAGLIGIGTTLPSASLHVVGNILASSVTASLLGTASYANRALSASYADNGGGSSVSASWVSASAFITTAQTASFVITAQTASYVSGINVNGVVSSASYTTSASYASNAGVAYSINFVPNTATTSTQSLYATQSIYATQSLFATNSLNATSASFASRSISASYAPVEPSYSSSAASYINTKQNTLVTGTTYTITSSWADNAVTATTANAISFVPVTATSASWVSASVFITTAQTASYVTASNVKGTVISASYAVNGGTATYTSSLYGTASWATDVVNGSTATYTSSLYGTASWALNTVTSSYSYITSSVESSSYADFAPVLFTNIRVIGGDLILRSSDTGNWYKLDVFDDGSGSFTTQLTTASATGSIFNSSSMATALFTTSSLSSSWASSSISASYALNGGGSGTTTLSASWVSASAFITTAQTASYVTSSNVTGIVSSASFAISASYALNGGSGGTTLTTGSTYPITSSWAINTVSQSASSVMLWVPTGSIPLGAIGFTSPSSTDFVISQQSSSVGGISLQTSGSRRMYIDTLGNIQFTGSVLGVATASFATTASFALNGGGSGTTLVTGSTYPITSSWATNVVNGSTATYTSSLYGTASWANNVVSSSYTTTASYAFGTEYIQLIHPHIFSISASVYTGSTSPLYGHGVFNATTVSSSNYVEYYLTVPYNIDTTKALRGQIKYQLISEDTASYSYVLSMASVADGNLLSVIPSNEVTLTTITTGSAGSVKSTGWSTLTGWSGSLSAGNLWKIRLARDGNDTSVSQSADMSVNIEYGRL